MDPKTTAVVLIEYQNDLYCSPNKNRDSNTAPHE